MEGESDKKVESVDSASYGWKEQPTSPDQLCHRSQLGGRRTLQAGIGMRGPTGCHDLRNRFDDPMEEALKGLACIRENDRPLITDGLYVVGALRPIFSDTKDTDTSNIEQ